MVKERQASIQAKSRSLTSDIAWKRAVGVPQEFERMFPQWSNVLWTVYHQLFGRVMPISSRFQKFSQTTPMKMKHNCHVADSHAIGGRPKPQSPWKAKYVVVGTTLWLRVWKFEYVGLLSMHLCTKEQFEQKRDPRSLEDHLRDDPKWFRWLFVAIQQKVPVGTLAVWCFTSYCQPRVRSCLSSNLLWKDAAQYI